MSNKILGNLTKGLVFVLSAPAGTGKTTLVRMLLSEFNCVAQSISCTTRPPRPEEIEGKDYFFLSLQEFQRRIAEEDFLEYASVFGHYYGTSASIVEEGTGQGKHMLLVIDTQGAMELKKKHFPAVFIFLSPPTLNELHARLLKRGTENEKELEKRLSWAQKEIATAKYYDYCIVNDDLMIAYDILRSILIAEEYKVRSHE